MPGVVLDGQVARSLQPAVAARLEDVPDDEDVIRPDRRVMVRCDSCHKVADGEAEPRSWYRGSLGLHRNVVGSKKFMEGCQWPLASAHGRPANAPAGGQ